MREVLVRDLAKCIDCKACVTACENRHGRARMTMAGARFGRYQLPDVCRNCPDTPCVNACHLDGMRRHEGKTFVSDACRGCNKCVQACPYGVVKLLPREHEERQGFFKSILAQAFGESKQAPANFHIATDATRCVQCGICGFNCPVGIQVREYAREGRTVDDERCIGCGLCVAKCPRGTLRFETYPTLPVSKFRADKCDLCRGYGESACVKECPTGAMLRLPADERLVQLNPALYDAVTQSNQSTHEHTMDTEPPSIPPEQFISIDQIKTQVH
ncbi:MAG: 4Fe-4S dicluster domain-containing protein [Chloroflexi bacterium]|nr:4Fe-4S dicluster domain-containing protein [Chloroflexota bacterium]